MRLPFRRTTRATAFVACVLAFLPLHAASPDPRLAQARASVTGHWRGVLGYRDYQSDHMFDLPVDTHIEDIPDGVTQLRRSRFDEGTGREPVWITTLSLLDADRGIVASTAFRAGREIEVQHEQARVEAYTDATHWRVVYLQTGEDNDAPAEIRVTETREGDRWTAVKDVRPPGAGESAWTLRNRTQLTRVAYASAR